MGDPLLSVRFSRPHSFSDYDDGEAGGLPSKMRLDKLSTLSISGRRNYTWSDAAWWKAFQQSTDLTRLVVSDMIFDGFIEALSAGVDGEDHIMMKKLVCIALHGMHASDESYLCKLRSMLVDRRSYGAPLQELRLVRCSGFEESDRCILEELVPKLHWEVSRWPATPPWSGGDGGRTPRWSASARTPNPYIDND